MARHFTEADVHDPASDTPRIYADRADLEHAPLEWQKRGLQETASGYGRRLNTGLKIHFGGRLYRIYAICFSNAATCYFTVRGRRIYVS